MRQPHLLLGRLLSAGVALSAMCLAAGLALLLIDRATGRPVTAPHPLLDAGLIILMATPFVRVMFALFEEIRHRNWFFASMTLTVAVLLCVTLWMALRSP